jgi:hypothetical protein
MIFIQRIKDAICVLFRGRWALVSRHNYEQSQKEKIKRLPTFRYFLTGSNQKTLWSGRCLDNDKMIMKEYCTNPYTDKLDWVGSFFDDWSEAKAHGVTELTRAEVEEKFPQSTKLLINK